MIDMLVIHNSLPPTSEAENGTAATATNKRKRRPAGTPDPDAEVVSLSPKTLLESDRYVCEICNQGFQRDQNLQMHRRRHKVPWKLLKRETTAVVKKRVFVCPEPSCLHHDPCHALGDLVGIKKHFRRKHNNHKQWVCERCSKGYAVQSDYKAHLKTCGTRGHSCDCGRVFSRVESFIEHQDACNVGRLGPETQSQAQAVQAAACLSRTASSETNFSTGSPWPQSGTIIIPNPTVTVVEPSSYTSVTAETNNKVHPNLELQLSNTTPTASSQEERVHQEQLRIAKAKKALAEEARKQAKRQIELAELEFTNAKRIRQEALAELDKAYAFKDHAIKHINSIMLQITCRACKHHFHSPTDDQIFSYITQARQVQKHRLKPIIN
ncbi:hypothetical protein JHK86_020565 [Glycine max]|nr:hypothetical protein JHK86_020565 [Glycine max]